MRFGTFGPYAIPLDEYRNIPVSLSDFWEEVDSGWQGLSGALGCYVFGVVTSGTDRVAPWYVGKTNNQGFASECFTPHKRNHYSEALNHYDRAKPQLYLIAQFTGDGDRLSRGSSGPAIDFLETYLIGLALRANEDLLNKKDTKLYREVVFPGFLNSFPGSPGAPANRLRQTLNL
jgi:hypothetical protein